MILDTEHIKQLFETYSKDPIESITKIPQSGGDRIYYRILTTTQKSFVATTSNNIKENETFLYFTNHFKSRICSKRRKKYLHTRRFW
jgi:hypothetical protein